MIRRKEMSLQIFTGLGTQIEDEWVALITYCLRTYNTLLVSFRTWNSDCCIAIR